MAINNFIPAVWVARALENLNKAHVMAALCNRDYEGDIRGFGDQVKINSIGRVTVGGYTKNTDINAPETLTDAQKILLINQQKYFNFQIDSIDRAQQNPKIMDTAMSEAAYALNNAADSYLLGLYTECNAANMIGDDTTPATVYSAVTEAYNNLVKMATILDENNVPADSRYVVVPAWFYSLLLLDSRFVVAGTDANNDARANAFVGRAAGFDIFKSNNIATATISISGTDTVCYHLVAGYRGTVSYAEQIVEVDAYQPEKRFGAAVKGLHVYGAKVVRPDAMCVHTIPRPTSLI